MKSYFVPNFPVNKIHRINEDGWVHIKNHPKNKYRWLDAVLELIENTGVIDPVQISIHNLNDIAAGPCGANRLYALVNIKKVETVPAVVYTKEVYNWFGNYELIDTSEKLKNLFRKEHQPDDFGVDERGRAYWMTRNVYDPIKIKNNMMVSEETKNRLIQMWEEEKDK